MDQNSPLPDRLKPSSPGLGEPASVDLEQRAAELARIDGRESFTDDDLDRAAAELGGTPVANSAPEETEPALEEVTTWDEPADQDGHEVASVGLDDDGTVAERLIQDGIDEAEHDRRVAAVDEDVVDDDEAE